MKQLLIRLIRFYQKHLSPLKPSGSCKFIPTCSEYAVQALEIHGAFKGSILAIWRIMRCNPFSEGGLDPVPEVWPGK